jgi:hypothetical protein
VTPKSVDSEPVKRVSTGAHRGGRASRPPRLHRRYPDLGHLALWGRARRATRRYQAPPSLRSVQPQTTARRWLRLCPTGELIWGTRPLPAADRTRPGTGAEPRRANGPRHEDRDLARADRCVGGAESCPRGRSGKPSIGGYPSCRRTGAVTSTDTASFRSWPRTVYQATGWPRVWRESGRQSSDRTGDLVGDREGGRVGDRLADNAEEIRQEDANRRYVFCTRTRGVFFREDRHPRRELAKPGRKPGSFRSDSRCCAARPSEARSAGTIRCRRTQQCGVEVSRRTVRLGRDGPPVSLGRRVPQQTTEEFGEVIEIARAVGSFGRFATVRSAEQTLLRVPGPPTLSRASRTPAAHRPFIGIT